MPCPAVRALLRFPLSFPAGGGMAWGFSGDGVEGGCEGGVVCGWCECVFECADDVGAVSDEDGACDVGGGLGYDGEAQGDACVDGGRAVCGGGCAGGGAAECVEGPGADVVCSGQSGDGGYGRGESGVGVGVEGDSCGYGVCGLFGWEELAWGEGDCGLRAAV